MNHIQGIDRFQLSFSCLDDEIDKDQPIRIIDTFNDKTTLTYSVSFSGQWYVPE
jgi:hypothetical protein